MPSRSNLIASIATRWGRGACVGLCLMAASPSAAQTAVPVGIRLDTGLYTFFSGGQRSVVVTVAETGPTAARSRVRIIYRDASERIVSTHEALLQRGQPVRHELPLDMAEARVQLRASIIIFRQPGVVSSPIVVLEDVDPGSFTSKPRISCAAPSGRDEPVLPFCPDVRPSVVLAP